MTDPNSKTTSATIDDKLEKTQKKADPSLTTQAIRQFIEHKLSSDTGGTNFDIILQNEGNGLNDEFLKFTDTLPELDDRSDAQMQALKNVTGMQFLRETLRIGAGFESKRKALIGLIESEYESGIETKKLQDTIHGLSLGDLTHYLRNSTERNKFVKLTFPNKSINKKDFLSFLNGLDID